MLSQKGRSKFDSVLEIWSLKKSFVDMQKLQTNHIYFYTVLSVVAWTIFIALILLWDLKQIRATAKELATKEAVLNISKDLAFRRWGASHGGVYAPPTERSPPNPYLKVPDRDVVTTTGKRLTLINPAYMVRQMEEASSDTFGIRGHLTSLKALNPDNKPDPWEEEALEAFEHGEKERTTLTDIDGKPFLRAIRPIKVEQSCMKCHGQQGYEVGDIRGGISASIDYLPYLARTKQQENTLFNSCAGILFVGYFAIAFFNRRAKSFSNERLRNSEQYRSVIQTSLDGFWITDTSGRILDTNESVCRMLGYSRGELLRLNISDIEADESPEEVAAHTQEMIKNGKVQFEARHKRKDGTLINVEVSVQYVPEFGDRFYAFIRNITERRESEEQIHSLAYFDELTKLPNRRLLLDRLGQALISSKRTNEFGALMILDLDNFKALNDTKGHDVGDRLLIEVAQLIVANVRQEDTVSRLGGDEYVVMIERMGSIEAMAASQAEMIAEKVRNALNKPYLLSGEEEPFHNTPSIGVTLFHSQELSIDVLLKQAEMALYQAKGAGRNAIRFFKPEMQATVESRSAMEAALRRGIEQGEFRLYYQPQVDHNKQQFGAEALLRWFPPNGAQISPAQFIPLAEDTGLIIPIGKWVLQTACAQLKAWSTTPRTSGLQIAVNVSARQFRQPDFVEVVFDSLKTTGANPSLLKLELTESIVLDNVEEVIDRMLQIKALGVSFSLDDFGTGFSSLSYLKKLPLDQMKIDQSFVRDIDSDPNDAAIVGAIIAMGKSLGIQIIAEGVETESQLHFLNDKGCKNYQGNLFGRPIRIEEWPNII